MNAAPRTGADLIKATVPFAETSTRRSWWYVGSTFALLTAALAGAGFTTAWPVRLLFSVLAALLMVRAFITYHDYMHRAILVRSCLRVVRRLASARLSPRRCSAPTRFLR